MRDSTGALRILRTRGTRELRVRALEHLAILREKLSQDRCSEMSDAGFLARLTPAAVPPIGLGSVKDRAGVAADAVIRRFRQRPVIASLSAKDSIRHLMLERFPDERAAIIRSADLAIEGQFNIFGRNDLSFGQPADWALEPLTGKRTPLVHWSEIDYLDPSVAGEKKITWELNRHSHFITFGQAYMLSADERYVRALTDQMNSWMDANPPNLGINWCSSLELAFRSIAWIWAISLVADSPSLKKEFALRVVKFLIAHGQHIESHLSTYFSPNTHLTGEALGLFYLGLALPEYGGAKEWKGSALRILMEQLRLQVRPDGVYFEQSSYYHRYAIDFYLNLLLITSQNGIELESELRPILIKMAEYLMWIIRPDSTPILIGDDDGGKLLPLGSRDPYDFRDSLALAASLLKNPRWKQRAGEDVPELLWLLGPEGLQEYNQLAGEPPREIMHGFPSSGLYFGRTGWDSDALSVFFRCGAPGALTGAHDHADQLSIELFANGTAWLVDPGTVTYTLSQDARNQFRLTGAHNTLTVDSLSQSIPEGPFSWKTRGAGTAIGAASNDRITYFEGEQDGYETLAEPVKHRRGVALVINKESDGLGALPFLIVVDYLKTEGSHRYALNYHFGQISCATVDAFGFRARDQQGNSLLACHTSSMKLHSSTGHAGLSFRYGQRSEGILVRVEGSAAGDQWIGSVIVPSPANKPVPRFACDQSGGSQITISWSDATDVIRFGDGIFTSREFVVQTSAEIGWLRHGRPDLLSLAIINGCSIAVKNLFKLRFRERQLTAVCELHGRQLTLRSDETGGVDLIVEDGIDRVKVKGGLIEVTPGSRLSHANGSWLLGEAD